MSETNSKICSHASEVAAYLDGELSHEAEFAFELHFEECSFCAEKLNEQKRLICSLEFVFDEKDFELPKDFAKKVMVRAESDVSGLNSKEERRRALLISGGLFLLGVLAGVVGKQSGILPAAVSNFLTQIYVLADVFGKFCYDFGVGLSVIFRVAGRQLVSGSSVSGFLLAFLLIISFILLSRLLLTFHRVKEAEN